MPAVVQPCPTAKCPQLLAEKAKLTKLQRDGTLAAAAYQPPGHRTDLPPGFREATPAELKQMNLSPADLEHPVDGDGKPTHFRAAVFVNETSGERVVAFNGTEDSPKAVLDPTTDWGNNARQEIGMDASYYTQAQAIASNVACSPYATSTSYTGHSLGGGLATAASRVSGRPASTFNAAPLHPTLSSQPSLSVVDAVRVKGDPVSGILGTTRGVTPYPPLDPPDDLSDSVARKYPWWDLKNRGKAALARRLELHSMATVNRAMAKRSKQLDAELDANNCGHH